MGWLGVQYNREGVVTSTFCDSSGSFERVKPAYRHHRSSTLHLEYCWWLQCCLKRIQHRYDNRFVVVINLVIDTFNCNVLVWSHLE